MFQEILVFIFIAVAHSLTAAEEFKYEIKTFDVRVDHFSYVTDKTFPLRYLVNDTFASSLYSPILFYTGNEADIEFFAHNTGFMWKAAAELNATIIFAEHRYYGQSMPLGAESLNNLENIGYLSSQQAMADFAELLQFLNPNAERKVITVGGSYAGKLAAWMRIKYPHLIVGALASSAPVRSITGGVPCDTLSRVITAIFRSALKSETNNFCVENIKNVWSVLESFTSSVSGRWFLNENFNFCNLVKDTSDFSSLYSYLDVMYFRLAMANYPYPTNFVGNLPANPVKEFCLRINEKYSSDFDLLKGLQRGIQIYSNYSGDSKCLASNFEDETQADIQRTVAWSFQRCTEMVYPSCSNGSDSDMFLKNFDEDHQARCQKRWGVKSQENALMTTYGINYDQASNIIFSNGLLDPWFGGGLLRSFNDKISIVIIPESAHHLDLRSDNPADPSSVRDARKFYIKKFKEWINHEDFLYFQKK